MQFEGQTLDSITSLRWTPPLPSLGKRATPAENETNTQQLNL